MLLSRIRVPTTSQRLNLNRNPLLTVQYLGGKGITLGATAGSCSQPSSRALCPEGGASALFQPRRTACRAARSSGPEDPLPADGDDDLGGFETFESFIQGNQQADEFEDDEGELPDVDLSSISQDLQSGQEEQDGHRANAGSLQRSVCSETVGSFAVMFSDLCRLNSRSIYYTAVHL